MKEKLSVKKVYRNAYRYIASHLFAFLFLTVFYFLGSLLPMFIGTTSFAIISPLLYYLFFYFAAGCYYKQQILWDKAIFITAGIRFIVAIGLFLTSILVASFAINVGIYFIRSFFSLSNEDFLNVILGSVFWLLLKYSFIFILFIVFFVIPSFAFVSEIAGKNRSLLTTYVKTKKNIFKIAMVALLALLLLILTMIILSKTNFLITSFVRAVVFVYVSILYFKMYDFFYELPQNKRSKKPEEHELLSNNTDLTEMNKDDNQQQSFAETKKVIKKSSTPKEKVSRKIKGESNAH